MVDRFIDFLNYFRRNKSAFSKYKADTYSIKISQNNFRKLDEIIENIKAKGFKQIVFEMADDSKEIVSFNDFAENIHKNHEKWSEYFRISFRNIPFCILRNLSSFALSEADSSFLKPPVCSECLAKNICPGISKKYAEIFGIGELRSILDLPSEVVIEVEPRCNFSCKFCFNKLSFARGGRNYLRGFKKDYVKMIVKAVAGAKIRNIRFTGGEPLLYPDILELLEFAKGFKFAEVRLNTNGSLIDRKTAQRLVKCVDNFLIPLESSGGEKEGELCGGINAFESKLSAIRFLKEAGAGIVRIGTVATKGAIEDFDKIEDLVSSIGVDRWELFRPIPFTPKGDIINRNDVEFLVAKLKYARRKEKNKKYLISNSLPFCAVRDQNSINSVSAGSLYDDGHSRFIIDPRGFAKPHYFIDEDIGDPLEPLSCWQHPFMKKMRTLQFLPSACGNCHFRFKCRGGSRKTAMLVNGSYDAVDPLANEN